MSAEKSKQSFSLSTNSLLRQASSSNLPNNFHASSNESGESAPKKKLSAKSIPLLQTKTSQTQSEQVSEQQASSSSQPQLFSSKKRPLSDSQQSNAAVDSSKKSQRLNSVSTVLKLETSCETENSDNISRNEKPIRRPSLSGSERFIPSHDLKPKSDTLVLKITTSSWVYLSESGTEVVLSTDDEMAKHYVDRKVLPHSYVWENESNSWVLFHLHKDFQRIASLSTKYIHVPAAPPPRMPSSIIQNIASEIEQQKQVVDQILPELLGELCNIKRFAEESAIAFNSLKHSIITYLDETQELMVGEITKFSQKVDVNINLASATAKECTDMLDNFSSNLSTIDLRSPLALSEFHNSVEKKLQIISECQSLDVESCTSFLGIWNELFSSATKWRELIATFKEEQEKFLLEKTVATPVEAIFVKKENNDSEVDFNLMSNLNIHKDVSIPELCRQESDSSQMTVEQSPMSSSDTPESRATFPESKNDAPFLAERSKSNDHDVVSTKLQIPKGYYEKKIRLPAIREFANSPVYCAIGIHRENGNIYICDEPLHRVVILDSSGDFLQYWGRPSKGRSDIGPGSLYRPISIAVTDKSIITLERRSRVQIWTLNGRVTHVFGSTSSIRKPSCICCDNQGKIYVTDTGFGRVAVFDSNGELAEILGEKLLDFPTHICSVKNNNRVVVIDKEGSRINVFESGKVLIQFSQVLPAVCLTPFLDSSVLVGDSDKIRILSTSKLRELSSIKLQHPVLERKENIDLYYCRKTRRIYVLDMISRTLYIFS